VKENMRTRTITTLLFVFILFTAPAFAQKSGDKTNIGKMISLYLDIKNALVNDDGTTARIKANELHYLITSNPDKGMSHQQASIFAANFQDLLQNVIPIGETTYENDQRPYFARLSIAYYNLLKELRISSPRLYLQYCPINKGYWLSETQTINNPYYNYKEWAHNGKTTEIVASR
jgi:hypothetical protein